MRLNASPSCKSLRVGYLQMNQRMKKKLKVNSAWVNRNVVLFISLALFLLIQVMIEIGCNKDDMKELTRKRKIMVTTVAGDGTPGFKDGPATVAQFRMPLDVAVDKDG